MQFFIQYDLDYMVVDGFRVDFEITGTTYRAVYWNNVVGQAELVNGTQVVITGTSQFQPLLDSFTIKKNALLNPYIIPLSTVPYLQTGIVTTNATPTVITTVPIPTTFFAAIEFEVYAIANATGVFKVWKMNGALRRLVAGPLGVGTITDLPGSPWGSATWTAVPTFSGNNLIITATGEAATTIIWFVKAEITKYNP